VIDLPDFEPLVHRIMSKAMMDGTDGKELSRPMMRLLSLITYNDYLLFPSKAERDARPDCRKPWFRDQVPAPEFQDSTEFAYDVIRKGLMENAIERAKRLGTYGQIDRSKQYEGPERARPEVLLNSVNALGNNYRQLVTEKDRMQKNLMNLKLRNSIITAGVTAVLVRSPEIVRFVWHVLR
jgi:hypothetical protein